MPACHTGGRGFESGRSRHSFAATWNYDCFRQSTCPENDVRGQADRMIESDSYTRFSRAVTAVVVWSGRVAVTGTSDFPCFARFKISFHETCFLYGGRDSSHAAEFLVRWMVSAKVQSYQHDADGSYNMESIPGLFARHCHPRERNR